MKGILIIGLIIAFVRTEGEIRGVLLLTGHGASSPEKNVSELDSRTSWIDGFGQQTALGARQMYLLGRMMKKLYIEDTKLLDGAFNGTETRFRALARPRNQMSARSLAYGMFHNKLGKLTYQEQSHEELWRPPFKTSFPDYVKTDLGLSATPFDVPSVPISSYNKSIETLLEYTSCGKYNKAWGDFFKSSKYQDLLEENNELINSISKKYTIPLSKLKLQNETLFQVCDYLIAAIFDGQLEDSQFEKYQQLYFDIHAAFLQQNEWTKTIAVHNFSSVLPDFFDAIINKKKYFPKFLALVADELTLQAFLFALTSKVLSIPYGSFFQFVLTQVEKNLNISIEFNGKIVVGPVDYSEFKTQLKSIGRATDNWKDLCSTKSIL